MRLILHLASLFLRGTALMLGLVGAGTGLACWAALFSDKLDILTHAAPIWLCCGLAGMAWPWPSLARASARRSSAWLGGVWSPRWR
jgi:hypothetical protein